MNKWWNINFEAFRYCAQYMRLFYPPLPSYNRRIVGLGTVFGRETVSLSGSVRGFARPFDRLWVVLNNHRINTRAIITTNSWTLALTTAHMA